jgi:hypothetical protein
MHAPMARNQRNGHTKHLDEGPAVKGKKIKKDGRFEAGILLIAHPLWE